MSYFKIILKKNLMIKNPINFDYQTIIFKGNAKYEKKDPIIEGSKGKRHYKKDYIKSTYVNNNEKQIKYLEKSLSKIIKINVE